MTDIAKQLRIRAEIRLKETCRGPKDRLANQLMEAADEIERLRQRVDELERENADHLAANKQMLEMMAEKRKELAAMRQRVVELEAGQGEPAYYEITTHDGIKWVGKHPSLLPNHTSVPLYTSAPTIPEGWQLVPIEPTNEMRLAGNFTAAMWKGADTGKAVWYDMLAVAPKPEAE